MDLYDYTLTINSYTLLCTQVIVISRSIFLFNEPLVLLKGTPVANFTQMPLVMRKTLTQEIKITYLYKKLFFG